MMAGRLMATVLAAGLGDADSAEHPCLARVSLRVLMRVCRAASSCASGVGSLRLPRGSVSENPQIPTTYHLRVRA
jgi:hypothetical protein